MVIRRLAIALVVVCAALVWTACHKCNFRLLWVHNITKAPTIPCCGGFLTQVVTIPDAQGSEVDLTNTLLPGETGRVDAWLVDTPCERLFEGTYPGAAPRCRTYIGPVAADEVSARVKLPSGTCRAIVQAYTSNMN